MIQKKLLSLIALLTLCAAENIIVEQCDEEKLLDSETIILEGVELMGCEDSFFKIEISRVGYNESDYVDLQIWDGLILLLNFTEVNVTSIIEIASNSPTLTFEGDGDWDLAIKYKGFPLVRNIGEPPVTGPVNGTDEILDLVPNSRIRKEFVHEQKFHLFDVSWNLRGPSVGFVAVQGPNGRWAALNAAPVKNSPLALSVVPSSTNQKTSIDLITQNSLKSFISSNIKIDYSLGKIILRFSKEHRKFFDFISGEDLPTSTTSTTSTTITPDIGSSSVSIFVIGVNETDFYRDKWPQLRQNIEDLGNPYENSANSSCEFSYSPVISCRQKH